MNGPRDIEPLAWIEVDLGAIRHNLRQLRKYAKEGTQLWGVVKADAYGHGAVEISRLLVEEGIERLCVARLEEARELRQAGLPCSILVFAPPLPSQAAGLIALDCECVVCSRETVEALVGAARRAGKRVGVHVKIDVGMGRLGLPPGEVLEFVRWLSLHPDLELRGVMSHLPCADTPRHDALTRQQIATFAAVRTQLVAAGFSTALFHLANSAALLDYPDAHFDAVRPGIALYGQMPSLEIRGCPALRPAMTMKSRILFLKDVPRGTGLSYGHTYVTSRPSRIATIALGYADGYPRHASNRTEMLVRGRLVPQVGRVCMDLSLLDVTEIPEVTVGDEVVAFGHQGDVLLRPEVVAAQCGTIGYELTTRFGRRLPRVYVNH